MNDMWAFHIQTKIWKEVFVNSVDNPTEREYATMVTVKADRLVLLFGG